MIILDKVKQNMLTVKEKIHYTDKIHKREPSGNSKTINSYVSTFI